MNNNTGDDHQMPNPAWIDGKTCDLSEATVRLEDRAYFFGDGIYEAIRVYSKNPFYLQAHLDRLHRSADAINLKLPYSDEEISSACSDLIRLSGYDEAYIYMQVSRGVAPREHSFPKNAKPSMSIYVREIPSAMIEQVARPAACITVPDERWMNCYIKSVNLLPNCLARQQAVEAGASEAILYRPGGVVTEGTRSNIFAVIGGEVRTHPESNLILSGITRRIILDIIASLRIPCREEAFTLEELPSASEVWITSTISELQPVAGINGSAVKGNLPGEYAKAVKAEFKKEVDSVRA